MNLDGQELKSAVDKFTLEQINKLKVAIKALQEISDGAYADNTLAGDIARRALHKLGELPKSAVEADRDRTTRRAAVIREQENKNK